MIDRQTRAARGREGLEMEMIGRERVREREGGGEREGGERERESEREGERERGRESERERGREREGERVRERGRERGRERERRERERGRERERERGRERERERERERGRERERERERGGGGVRPAPEHAQCVQGFVHQNTICLCKPILFCSNLASLAWSRLVDYRDARIWPTRSSIRNNISVQIIWHNIFIRSVRNCVLRSCCGQLYHTGVDSNLISWVSIKC